MKQAKWLLNLYSLLPGIVCLVSVLDSIRPTRSSRHRSRTEAPGNSHLFLPHVFSALRWHVLMFRLWKEKLFGFSSDIKKGSGNMFKTVLMIQTSSLDSNRAAPGCRIFISAMIQIKY